MTSIDLERILIDSVRVMEIPAASGQRFAVEVVDLPLDVALKSLDFLSDANAAISIVMAAYVTSGHLMMIAVDVPEDVATTCVTTFAREDREADAATPPPLSIRPTRFVLPVWRAPAAAVAGRTVALVKVLASDDGNTTILWTPPMPWTARQPQSTHTI